MFYRTADSIAFLCFVLWNAGACNAGLRRASTWTAESPDGKLIFVMIPPITLQEEEEQGNTHIDRAREIRNRFPSSGLYSTEPDSHCLWEADFYLNDPGYVSSDGRHVVVLGPFTWSSVPWFDGDAILYAIEDGCVVNTTYYSQLTRLWWIKRIVFGDGPQCEDYGLKPNIVWIKTNYWEESNSTLIRARMLASAIRWAG